MQESHVQRKSVPREISLSRCALNSRRWWSEVGTCRRPATPSSRRLKPNGLYQIVHIFILPGAAARIKRNFLNFAGRHSWLSSVRFRFLSPESCQSTIGPHQASRRMADFRISTQKRTDRILPIPGRQRLVAACPIWGTGQGGWMTGVSAQQKEQMAESRLSAALGTHCEKADADGAHFLRQL